MLSLSFLTNQTELNKVKIQDLREKMNIKPHLVPSFDTTIAEATKESIETKPINNNEVHNFIFFYTLLIVPSSLSIQQLQSKQQSSKNFLQQKLKILEFGVIFLP